MSETIVVGTGSELIHGTFAAAKAYCAIMFGDTYDAWNLLTDDQKKKTLARAVRFLNAQAWTEDADTFAEREALLVNSVSVFHQAQYDLAVLISDDPDVVAQVDQGSNIASLGAGSASISFFNPTTKNADVLPPVLMRLVGSYLALSSLAGPDGGESRSSCATNPFSDCEDYDRDREW